MSKKKGWIKGSKGEKKLQKKLSEKTVKSEDEKLKSRYGS